MIAEYTLLTAVSIVVVIALELCVVHSGIFRRAQYWLAMAICLGFQCLVDGWLTKLGNPIVVYNPEEFLGIRFPFDIPIEDFGFGFALMTAVLMLWQAGLNRRARREADPQESEAQGSEPQGAPAPRRENPR